MAVVCVLRGGPAAVRHLNTANRAPARLLYPKRLDQSQGETDLSAHVIPPMFLSTFPNLRTGLVAPGGFKALLFYIWALAPIQFRVMLTEPFGH
jgi:hypothetical protein